MSRIQPYASDCVSKSAEQLRASVYPQRLLKTDELSSSGAQADEKPSDVVSEPSDVVSEA